MTPQVIPTSTSSKTSPRPATSKAKTRPTTIRDLCTSIARFHVVHPPALDEQRLGLLSRGYVLLTGGKAATTEEPHAGGERVNPGTGPIGQWEAGEEL
jgi:hypothetical protein